MNTARAFPFTHSMSGRKDANIHLSLKICTMLKTMPLLVKKWILIEIF